MTLLAAVLLSVFLTGQAWAADLPGTLGLDSLTRQLPEEAAEYMDGAALDDVKGGALLERLLSAGREKLRTELASVMKTAGILLTVCVTVAIAGAADVGGSQSRFILLAGVTAIGAAGLSDLNSYLHMGTQTLHNAADYAKILLPVLASAAAAAGSPGGAAARFAATSLFISVLLDTADAVVMPCISAYAALSVANAAVGNDVLKGAKKLLKRLCETLLTCLCLAFTAWLGLSGVAADPADAMASRAAKTAISAALPVVGGILSDAAGSLAAAAGALRSSIGVFGILAVAFICLGPFAALGTRFLAYKISASLCCTVSEKRLSDLAEDLGTCFGLILSVNGAGALMLFISIYSLIRTAT